MIVFFRRTTLAVVALLATIGCGKSKDAGTGSVAGGAIPADASIRIDGSSTVFPVSEAIAEEFMNAMNRKVRTTVGTSGTGGGFKKFVRGEIDISNASRPILAEEMKLAREAGIEYIELPICFDALTVAVNPQATWVDSITVAELKKIWEPSAERTITKWNQIRPEWPDAEFKLYGAGADSGTFDYFTEAVVGKAKSSRSDFSASEDDNTLVTGIEGNKYALGYIPFAYYEANKSKLKALAIDWEKDQLPAVLPSLEAVIQGKYNPLSRPLFIYVSKASAGRPEVKAYVEFVMKNVASLAKEVSYLPLPAKAYEMGQERFDKMQTGTGFNGVPEVGMPVEDLLKREPKS